MEETAPGAIPINPEIISQFSNEQFNHHPGPGEPLDEVSYEALQKAAGYIIKVADDALAGYAETLGGTEKEVEKIKWAEKTRMHVSELSVLVGKRKLSDNFLQNSPELLLGSVIAGKLVIAGMVIAQIKRRNPVGSESTSTQESKQETDSENE